MTLSDEESTRPFTDLVSAGESTRPFTDLEKSPCNEEDEGVSTTCVVRNARVSGQSEKETALTNTTLNSVNELENAFTNASLSSLPAARLILAYHVFPNDVLEGKNGSVIRLPHKTGADGWDMIGVVQRMEDVDFDIEFPFHDPPNPSPGLRQRPYKLHCRIYYNPNSDDCVFVHYSSVFVYLTRMDGTTRQVELRYAEQRTIRPGIWRIEAGGGRPPRVKQHLVDFLLLRRRFRVSTHEYQAESATPVSPSVDQPHCAIGAKKRKLLGDMAKIIVAPAGKPESAQQNSSAAEARIEQTATSHASSQHLPRASATLLADLSVGEVAVIQGTEQWVSQGKRDRSLRNATAKSTMSYSLKCVESLSDTKATKVFACEHSSWPSEKIVAKVLRCGGESPHSLTTLAHLLKSETEILPMLSHNNIVSLKGFDGRFLVIFLEYLSATLSDEKISQYTAHEAAQILRDLAPALAHMAGRNVMHCDIKPANIAFSPERGAVFIDYGVAVTAGERRRLLGGSPWYMPPEWLYENVRGLPGDVWALGVTMLYVLGKIERPEKQHKYRKGWIIHDLLGNSQKSRESYQRMVDWLADIAERRKTLNQSDPVEFLVYQMLEPNYELRIEASTIESGVIAAFTPATKQEAAEEEAAKVQDAAKPTSYGEMRRQTSGKPKRPYP